MREKRFVSQLAPQYMPSWSLREVGAGGHILGHFEPHWEMVGKENTKGKGDLNDICVNARS
jgi:hypothetical protein